MSRLSSVLFFAILIAVLGISPACAESTPDGALPLADRATKRWSAKVGEGFLSEQVEALANVVAEINFKTDGSLLNRVTTGVSTNSTMLHTDGYGYSIILADNGDVISKVESVANQVGYNSGNIASAQSSKDKSITQDNFARVKYMLTKLVLRVRIIAMSSLALQNYQ